MKKRLISAPSQEVLNMMKRRMSSEARTLVGQQYIDAVGLLMLSIPELYFYADLAAKSANVIVSEITGSCPQHVTTLAILGEISAVKIAMEAIEALEQNEHGF
ncbi:BMC domain-containing protein [Testudinibacter sp. P27/CKL/0425]